MGIYDREYYRREGPSFLASFAERGLICKWLIAINVVVFILQLLTGNGRGSLGEIPVLGHLTANFSLNCEAVLQGQVWRLLTYAFLHDTSSILHIVFNMLFLWWFGKDLEDLYGPREFLAFYLVSAFLGGVAFVLAYVADIGGAACIGASGAVTAVLVLCAFHYPNRVILLFFFLPVPIWLFVGFSVAQDLFGFLGGGNDMTAYAVHLGGAAFAFTYFKTRMRLLNFIPGRKELRSLRPRSRPRLRVYREDEPEARVPVATPGPDVDEQLEANTDAVLRKVADKGMDSLSPEERRILLKASEVYKRRRE